MEQQQQQQHINNNSRVYPPALTRNKPTPVNHLKHPALITTTTVQTCKTKQMIPSKLPTNLPSHHQKNHYYIDNGGDKYNYNNQQCAEYHTYLCLPRQSTHHHHDSGSSTKQEWWVLRREYYLAWMVVAVLLLLLVFVSVARPSTYTTTRPTHHIASQVFTEELSEPRREESDEESASRIWPQTTALLPVLYHHYHTHALSLHQPTHYMSEQTKEIWHFTSIKQHSQHSQVELFLHTAIKNFTLAITSTDNTSLTYEFNLDIHASQTGLSLSSHDLDGNKVNLPYKTMLTAYGDWAIIDITNFMTNWLLNQAQFSVEIPRPPNWARIEREKLLLLQPVVCVKQQTTFEERTSDVHSWWGVKEFISSYKEGKKLTKKQRIARDVPSNHSRTRRKSVNNQCHLREVEVSLQEMGLREVEYPDTLLLRYCDGSCHILSHPDHFSVNALLRAKFRLLWGPRPVPAPHCIPVTYQTQLLFVWQDGHIILARYSDLNARTCGCR